MLILSIPGLSSRLLGFPELLTSWCPPGSCVHSHKIQNSVATSALMVGTIPEGQHLPDESVSSSESPSRIQAIIACRLSHISTWWTLRHILEYGQRNSLSSCPNYPTPISPSLGVNLVSPPNTRSSEAATGHHSLMCTLPHTSDIHYVLAILSLKCLLNLPLPQLLLLLLCFSINSGLFHKLQMSPTPGSCAVCILMHLAEATTETRGGQCHGSGHSQITGAPKSTVQFSHKL